MIDKGRDSLVHEVPSQYFSPGLPSGSGYQPGGTEFVDKTIPFVLSASDSRLAKSTRKFFLIKKNDCLLMFFQRFVQTCPSANLYLIRDIYVDFQRESLLDFSVS